MSYETRRKIRPITTDGQDSIAKRIEILQTKKLNAEKYGDMTAAKKLDEEIVGLNEKLEKRKLKQDA